jgi:hypothetical protein
MDSLKVATGYAVLIFVGVLGLMILWRIYQGEINLSRLITDENGEASMSRFQLLVFTFVIALSLFLVVVGQPTPKFPELPGSILSLLGISASSYLVSKGISSAADVQPRTTISISPANAEVAPGQKVQFAAAVSGQPGRRIIWSIDAPAKGSIDPMGLLTADYDVEPGSTITVRASTDEESTAAGVRVVKA